MKRISHDLAGSTQRLAKLTAEYHVAIDETRAQWRDATGHAFLAKHTAEIQPTVSQLISGMTRSIELFEQIAKQLRDPETPGG